MKNEKIKMKNEKIKKIKKEILFREVAAVIGAAAG